MKKLCLIEQGKYVNHEITLDKKKLWQTDNCDYIRFNWYKDDDPNADYTPKDVGGERIRWSQGRDFLFSKVIDKYEYILYTDEDTVIHHYDGKNPHDELIKFLDEWSPIGLNIHTTNIWCHNETIIKKNMNGIPCLVRKHDACNVILRNDIASLVHPIKYHGSDAVTHYQQFLCHTLRKEHYMSPPNLYATNMIEEQHYHVDDREESWKSKIIQQFGYDLKNSKPWINFVSNKAVTTPALAKIKPLKNAPVVTKKEFQKLFTGELKMIQEQVDELKRITGSSQLTGWVKENIAHFLSGFVRYADVNLVLNIGHLWGKSSLVFCDAMFNEKKFETNWDVGDPSFLSYTVKSKNPSNIREVHSVDPLLQGPQWRPPNAIEGTKYIKGLYPDFTFHHMKSGAFFDSGFDFSKYNRKLVFIDGDHSYEGALADVKNAVKYGFDFILIDDTSYISHIEKAAKDGMTSDYDFISLPLWNGLNLLVRK